jgi:hypothetical protein
MLQIAKQVMAFKIHSNLNLFYQVEGRVLYYLPNMVPVPVPMTTQLRHAWSRQQLYQHLSIH